MKAGLIAKRKISEQVTARVTRQPTRPMTRTSKLNPSAAIEIIVSLVATSVTDFTASSGMKPKDRNVASNRKAMMNHGASSY